MNADEMDRGCAFPSVHSRALVNVMELVETLFCGSSTAPLYTQLVLDIHF